MPNKKRPGTLTTRYKKQHGLHHKHNSRYIKVYWPYLPVFAFVISGIIASLVILASKPGVPLSSVSTISVSSLLSATNQARQSSELKSLQLNSQLNTAAQEKANEMAIDDYWSPISPTGQTPWQIIQSTGYKYQAAGENLAYGFSSTQSLLSAWLDSPSHKANVFNNNYQSVGFGIADSPDYQNQGPQIIVVALYASSSMQTTTTRNGSNGGQAFTTASINPPNSQAVVRAESLFSKNSFFTVFICGMIVGVVGSFLLLKHGLLLKKWVTEGEELVIQHPFLDIVLVIFLVGAASLNQTVGIIR